MKTIYTLIFLSIVSIVLSYSIGAFYAYFYPMKYQDDIVSFSAQYGVDAGIIASVANVESGFDENVISDKGAIGVMQLMPSTAQWLAEKLVEDYSEDLLFNGQYNLKLGSFYLSYLFTQFEVPQTALCAYNAGPGKVKEWLKDSQLSSDGKTLSRIPYQETKNYLDRVMKSYRYYKIKYKNLVK